jgi:hypothetical protein
MENILSQYVITFLDKHSAKKTSSKNLVEQWNSDQTQNELKSLVSALVPSSDPGKKDKKDKKIRDPNAPKRGKSSYLVFCNEYRDKVKQENPSLNAKEITSELGKRWNLLKETNPEKVAEYEKVAVSDRERYHEQKKTYVPSVVVKAEEKPKTERAPRGKSGYILFCTSERDSVKSANPNMSAKEITSELGKLWNELKVSNPDKIKKFEDSAKSQRSTSSAPAPAPVVEEKPKHVESSEQVEPFDNFCKDKRKKVQKENPDLTSKDISKKLKKMWKGLSDKEKEKYA